jgi:dihydrofolate reductase
MRKLVLAASITVDGFMGRPDGSLDWLPNDSRGEHDRDALELLRETGTIIVGSHAAADMAAHWPKSDAPIAEPMNTLPKLVFSRRGATIDWNNTEMTDGDLREEVERLKGESGGHIVAYGGAAFAQSLTRERLVDEYRLTVCPTILGDGLPIFDRSKSQIDLELVESKTLGDCAVTNRFRRV